MKDSKKYNQIKQQAYKKYKKINQVYCPYLKDKISFNSQGFWHMIYTARNKKRPRSVQLLRFKLMPYAVQIVKITTTLQEVEKIRRKRIIYFGFIAIIEGWKIKVIVKKVGRGKPIFWSVIPNWITNRKRDRLLHKGSMKYD